MFLVIELPSRHNNYRFLTTKKKKNVLVNYQTTQWILLDKNFFFLNGLSNLMLKIVVYIKTN